MHILPFHRVLVTIASRALGGGSLENDLQPWEELFAREGCALRTTIACRAWGGKFRKWLAIVTRTLCKGRMRIQKYHCMQSFRVGSLENDLQWWQELYAREGCAFRNTMACRAFRGGSLENDLQSWQELYEREGCALRNTIVCRALGGKFIKMTCNREKNSMQGKDVHWGLPLHAELWGGGKFRKWLAIVTRTLHEREGSCIAGSYHCMQSFGGGGSFTKMTCKSFSKNFCEREGCALRNTIACRALGGEV